MGLRLRAILDGTRGRTQLTVRRAFAASATALVSVLAAFAPVPQRVTHAIPSPDLVLRPSAAVTPTRASVVSLKLSEQSATDPVESQVGVLDVYPEWLPAIGQGTCDTQPRGKKGSSSHISRSDNGARTWEVRWKRGDCSFEVDARGTLTLNDEAQTCARSRVADTSSSSSATEIKATACASRLTTTAPSLASTG